MEDAEQPSWLRPGLHQTLKSHSACSPETPIEASHPALPPYKHTPFVTSVPYIFSLVCHAPSLDTSSAAHKKREKKGEKKRRIEGEKNTQSLNIAMTVEARPACTGPLLYSASYNNAVHRRSMRDNNSACQVAASFLLADEMRPAIKTSNMCCMVLHAAGAECYALTCLDMHTITLVACRL